MTTPNVAAPHGPSLAEAHRSLKVGSPVTDQLIARAITEACESHAELVAQIDRSRRLDPRVRHLGEAVDLLIAARPHDDAVEALREDLALAMATARSNDYLLSTLKPAIDALGRRA